MATRDQINGQNEKMATRNEYVRARDWSIGDRSAIDRLIDERESSDLPISPTKFSKLQTSVEIA